MLVFVGSLSVEFIMLVFIGTCWCLLDQCELVFKSGWPAAESKVDYSRFILDII